MCWYSLYFYLFINTQNSYKDIQLNKLLDKHTKLIDNYSKILLATLANHGWIHVMVILNI